MNTFHFLWWIVTTPLFHTTSDFLWWPGSQISDLNHITTNFVDHSLQIHENILKDAKPFCPNLNCIQTRCSIHSMSIINCFYIIILSSLIRRSIHSRGRNQWNISPRTINYKWSYDVEPGKQMWRLLLQRWKVPYAGWHGNFWFSSVSTLLLYIVRLEKWSLG